MRHFLKLTLLTLIVIVLSGCVTEQKIASSNTSEVKLGLLSDLSSRRALSYMNIQQYKTAEQILDEGLELNPKHSNLNYTYALLKLQLEEPAEADKYFSNAIKFDPKNSIAVHDYGYYLCSKNERKKGIEMFDLAISNPLFTQKSKSYLRAGECMFSENIDKAESYFLNAYSEDNQLSSALFRLAELYYAKNTPLKARAYYQRYNSVQGDNPAGLYLGYKVEKLLKADKVAKEIRYELLTKFPGSPEATRLRNKEKL